MRFRHRGVVVVGGTRVLVVDDNQTNLMILNEMLSNWGMLPTLAESGDLALNEIAAGKEQGEPFLLVITDVNMPEMSGFDFVEKLRADQALAETQVIALTSGGRDGDDLIMDRLQHRRTIDEAGEAVRVVRRHRPHARCDSPGRCVASFPEQEEGPFLGCFVCCWRKIT